MVPSDTVVVGEASSALTCCSMEVREAEEESLDGSCGRSLKQTSGVPVVSGSASR